MWLIKGLLKWSITIALLGFVLSKIDVLEFFSILSAFDPLFFLLAFCIQFSLSILQAIRWRIIVNSAQIKIERVGAWLNVLIGLFFNQAFPSSIGGDAMRIYFAKSIGVGSAFRTIIIDRIFALLTLSVISLCICCVFFLTSSDLPYIELMLLAELLLILGCFAPIFGELVGQKLKKFKRVNLATINTFCCQFREIFYNQTKILQIAFMSITIHFFVSVSGVLLFLGMGSDISPLLLGAIFALVNLFSVIPISFGGWGVREGVAIALFSSLDIETEVVFAVSVLFGVLMIAVGLSGGAIWFLASKKARALKI